MKRSVNFSNFGPNDKRKRFDYMAQLMHDVGATEEEQRRALIQFKLIELKPEYEFITAHCPKLFAVLREAVNSGLTGEEIAKQCKQANPLARTRIAACADYLRLSKL